MSYTLAEARGKRLHWLLTVRVAGRIVRLAEEAVSVDEALGGLTHVYLGGLEDVSPPSLVLADGGESPNASASVAWRHPTAGGWAAYTDADPDLQDATAELALWVEGSDYDRRHVVLDGPLSVTSYDEAIDLVEATIALRVYEDRGLIPDPALTVSMSRWPRVAGTLHIPDDSLDVPYPLVYGAPGYGGADALLTEHRGWRVPVVEIDESDGDNSTAAALVLIHGEPAAAEGSSVKLYNLTTGASASVSVTATQDLAGTWVAVASVAVGTLAITEGDELWASATSATAVGILAVGARTGGIGVAGDLARWLLARSTIRVDLGAMEGDLERLNAYRVSGAIPEPSTPTQVLADLLTLLPCAWYVAPRGLALRVWPEHGALPLASVGPTWGCERAGPREPGDPTAIYDAWRIDYDVDGPDGPKRHLSLVPDGDPSDADEVVNPYAVRSNARGGLPPTRYALRWADTIEATQITDRGTAFALLSRAARMGSRLPERVSYLCPPEYQLLPLGCVIRWVDADRDVDRLCRLVEVEMDLESPALTLETLPDAP